MDCGGLTAASTTTTLDDLFSFQNTEVDVGVEWLSVFMEECLSNRGSCLPPPKAIVEPTTASDPTSPSHPRKRQNAHLSFDNFAVAGKARSKRKRIAAANSKAPLTTPWSQSYHLTPAAQTLDRFPSPDTPLLDQAYWLADSELIVPNRAAAEKRKLKCTAPQQGEEGGVEGKGTKGSDSMGIPQPRRCSHCLSQRTPQWRAGPLGPKTLCNACGVRYKSGRLLPEYRPAKSPTFVSYLHSNSHKKVMEMRIGMGTGAGAGTVSSTPAGREEGS